MSKVNVSGTWRDIAACSVNVSGTWRTVSEIHANVSGTWKKVWPLATVTLTNQQPSSLGFGTVTTTAGAYFNTNGIYYNSANFVYTAVSGQWYDPTTTGIGSSYQIRATQVSTSGTATRSGPTLNTWHALSTARHWYIQTNSLGYKSWVLDIEIRDASTLVVVASARYTMAVENI